MRPAMFQLAPLPRTLEAAVRDVRDRKTPVRLSALRDLVRLAAGPGRDRALPALEAALEEDESALVRAEAALALADAEAHGAVERLAAAALDVHARVRQMAVLALGEVGRPADGEARQAVATALEDEAPAVRFQALIAHHRLQGPAAAPAIFRALEDADPQVRHIALRIAEDVWVGPESPVPEEVRLRARDHLEDPAPRVRLGAAILLARAGDLSGRATIVEAVTVGKGAAEPEDEQAAIELAGELGFEEARRGLERRAWGGPLGLRRDPFAWQARIALARLGHGRARAAILQGLRARRRESRTLAVVAAGQAGLKEARQVIATLRGDPRRAEPDAVEEALRRLDAC